MRTTVTLDPDVAALVKKAMRERGRSFTDVLNEALRAGLGATSVEQQFDQVNYSMDEQIVPLDKALQLAGALEDEDLIRLLGVRS